MHVRINQVRFAIPPTAVLGKISRPILAPDEGSQIDGQIDLWWKNVAPSQGGKSLSIDLVIFCWDSRGRRHETRYSLFVEELYENVFMPDAIAPGVTLESRHVTSRSVWFLKLSRRVKHHWAQTQFLSVQKDLPQIAKAQKLAREWWAKHKKK